MSVLFTRRGMPPDLHISFSIYDSAVRQTFTFYAKKDMTWGEWCDSGFNTNGFFVGSVGYIRTEDGSYCIIDTTNSNVVAVVSNDKIVNGRVYEIGI